MKKPLRLSAIAVMAFHSFANAQQDTTSVTKSADSATTSAMKKSYASVTTTYKLPYVLFTPEYNFSKLLDGQATGLQTTNGGGQPGASADMIVRGISNISGDNNPLIVIDGIPYFGDYASINKNDIQSITLLKDAAATFEFGNRGSNGIISIKTKSKTPGAKHEHKERLEVNAQFGTSTPELPAYKTVNPKEYFETLYSSIHNAGYNFNVVDYAGGYNPYNVPKDQLIGSDGKLNPNAQLRYQDNWRDEMSRAGIRQDYNVATSDDGKAGAYYLSTGYLNDKGYVQQTDYERFSARFNGHLNITKWLKLGVRSQAAIADQHFTPENNSGSLLEQSQLMAPVYPVYYRNSNDEKETDPATGMNKFDWGNTIRFPNNSIGVRQYEPGENGIGSLWLNNNTNKTNTFILNPYLSASFLKHFTYTANFNYTFNKVNSLDHYNSLYGQFAGIEGAYDKASNELRQLNFRQKLEWEKQWTKHHLKWTVGNDYIKQNQEYNAESGQSGGVPASRFLKTGYHMLSYYTMADYDYKDKYFAFAGIREDQTAANNYMETNWFVGALYRVSNENFLKDLRWINNLDLKLDYGTQGHSILPVYQFNTPVPSIVSKSVLPNNQVSGGIAASLFNNRLSFEILAYNRNSASIYLVPQPPSTNWPPIPEQTKFNNKGIELFLNTAIIQQHNFSWNTTFRLTHNTNKIVMMPLGVDSFISSIYQYKKGNTVADFYLPEYAGVDKGTGAALYYIKDANGNKTTTSNYTLAGQYGRINAGSALPKVYGSFTNTFEWKSFEFSFQVNYSLGGKYYDQVYQSLMANGLLATNWSTDILNAWTPTNTNTDVPIVNMATNNADAPSTRFLKDASYLSFANAYLGYQFNYEKIKKLKMQSLRIYLSANNIAMIAGRKGMNPQADFYNNPGYVYSPARTIVFGLKVGI